VATVVSVQQAIPERIDRLPLSRELWRIILLAGIAWLIESYDIGIIGNTLPSLKELYHLGSFGVGLISIASTLGIVVSVIPSGRLADRFGRKTLLIWGTVWYAIFSFACGFAPNVQSVVILRFIAGLGMGAVFPIPYAMAAELISWRSRGAITAILDSFLSFGYFLAPLIALVLVPSLPNTMNWRILFLIGGIPLLYVPVLIKWMPESPRWLYATGRTSEADQIVCNLEDAIERRTGERLPAPQVRIETNNIKPITSPAAIFKHEYLKRTIMMWISFACILFIFYAIQTYTPTVLLQQGYGIGNSFLFTTIIVLASIPGKYLAAYTIEHFGRKPTLLSFTLIAAIGAVLFSFSQNVAIALLFGCIMSFFGIGVDPAIKIYGAEQYPTAIRETGVSSFECVGRLFGGALAPFIMSFTLTSVGIPGSYIFVAAIAIIGVIAVMVLGKETKGQVLEKATELEQAA
jgi:putative MFS transporter